METVGIRITAADATRGAFDTVGANLKALQGSAAGVSAALAGIGAGISIGGFIALTKAAIDSLDALNDIKDATGASIENISALEDVARRTGTSFDTVGAALIKLNKALTTAKPGSDTEKAINAIGLSIKELKTLDPAEAFQRIAVGLSKFADDGNKARLSQELFGKSLKEIAPLLKDIAEKGALVGTVTTAEAEAAEAFNKQLFAMQKNLLDVSRSMVGPMVEGLNGLIAKFKEGAKTGDGFLTTLVKQSEIYALFAQTSQIPGFGGNLSRAPRFTLDYNQSEAEMARLNRGAALRSVGDVLADTAATKAATDANAALIASVQAGAAALKAEAESAQELTAVQKEIAKIYEEISTSKNKYNLQTLLTVDALLQEKLAYEKTIIARKDASAAQEERIKLGRAAAIADGQAVEAANAAYADALDASKKLQEQYDAGFQSSAQRVADQVQALQDEALALEISAASHISLAQAVEQVSIARLNERLAIELSYGNDVAAAAIRKEIEARKELAGLIDSKTAREASKDAAQDAAAEWRKAADQIQTSITDALLRGFESGKDIAANLRDTIVNMFKTLVLRPVISAVVNPVAQGLTGALGLSGAANAAGSAGSLLGAGASIFGSGGLAGALSGGAGWLTGSTTLSGALSAGASLIGTGSMAGLASGIGVLAGALGPIALGIGVLSSLFGGTKNKQQNTGNATSFFDATGTLTKQDTFFGGSSASADSVINGLQSAYAKAAAALSIGTVATSFNFGSNVRKDGTDPRFALGGYAGTSSFQQGETASSDAAMSLAASRAVFAALQGSELPQYLAGVFNAIDPAASSQEQIAAALEFAGSLKLIRDALSETRTPLQILQDDLAAGTAALSTSTATFKADFLAAIDGGITPELLTQWQALGGTMDQLAAVSGNAEEAITLVGRSLADIANERQSLQDQLDELTLTSAQLRAKERATIDATNLSLYDQVQAQEDLKLSTDAAAESARELATTNAGLQDQLDLLTGTQNTRSLQLRDATDESTKALLRQIFAQEDLQTAAEATTNTLAAATAAAAESARELATTNAGLQDQLDLLTGTQNTRSLQLRDATDESTKALLRQIFAQEDLKTAAEASAEAIKTAAETIRVASQTRLKNVTTGASDAFSALQRAVAAEQAINTAAYEAQRAIATAAYTSQQATMQTSIDGTRASLDAVADSVGRIKSLSGSLKSALDGMRISGSEGSSRAIAQAEISAAVARARAGGGLPLDGQLSSALATVAKPSEQLFASFNDYARDFYKTANDIASLSDLSDAQLSGAQSAQATLQDQLDALEDQKRTLKDGFDDQVDSLSDILNNAQLQLDAANGINTSVLSVSAALTLFDQSIRALITERANQGQATTPGTFIGPLPPAGDQAPIPRVGDLAAHASVAQSRIDTIREYATWLAGQAMDPITMIQSLAAAAKTNGVSESEIATAYNLSAAETREYFRSAGIPQFAVGTNYVPRDMLAQIHEGEAIIPRAYNPAAAGSNNADLVAEIRNLRVEISALKASSESTATSSRKTAAMIETATEGGRAMLTEVYT